MGYFKDLRKKHTKKKTTVDLFSTAAYENDDGLRASFKILLLIAKAGYYHAIGETVIALIICEVMTNFQIKDPEPVFRAIS